MGCKSTERFNEEEFLSQYGVSAKPTAPPEDVKPHIKRPPLLRAKSLLELHASTSERDQEVSISEWKTRPPVSFLHRTPQQSTVSDGFETKKTVRERDAVTQQEEEPAEEQQMGEKETVVESKTAAVLEDLCRHLPTMESMVEKAMVCLALRRGLGCHDLRLPGRRDTNDSAEEKDPSSRRHLPHCDTSDPRCPHQAHQLHHGCW